MPDFYVNVVVHGGLTVEAETEDDAISKAEGFGSHENLEDVYHVDTGTVDHEDCCDCPDCKPEEDE